MKFLSLFLMFILISSITLTNFAFAYEKENHYWLKIALALNCGFTLDEARLIGIGDFSIDEDDDTKPVRPGSGKDNAKWKWHALPTENPDVDKSETSKGNQEIKQRQHDLYDRAMNEKNTSMKLFKFGQYLHYQEDKWSHWGYTTGIGHAVPNITPGMTSPDETHADPEHYRDMAFDSMVNLGKLAKSLGKDTQCVSSLIPLDTYHSAPEYGSDFPWFSPQEIKRTKDPEKFQKDVTQYLDSWGKTALINEVITESQKNGDDGVTESFITYIANHTGKTTSEISKKYDYTHIDIDENGNAKKIPDNLVKAVTTTKTSKTTDKKSGTDKTKSKDIGKANDAFILKTASIVTSIQSSNSKMSDVNVLKTIKGKISADEYKTLVALLDVQVREQQNQAGELAKDIKITDKERASVLVSTFGLGNLHAQISVQSEAQPFDESSQISPEYGAVKNAIKSALGKKSDDRLKEILNSMEDTEKHLADLIKNAPDKPSQEYYARILNAIRVINSNVDDAKKILGPDEDNKKETKVSDSKTQQKEKSDKAKTKSESNFAKHISQDIYSISVKQEIITNLLIKSNDVQFKTLNQLLKQTKTLSTKTKDPAATKLIQSLQKQIKDSESDKRILQKLEGTSKRISQGISKDAKKHDLTKSDLDKSRKQAISSIGSKIIEEYVDDNVWMYINRDTGDFHMLNLKIHDVLNKAIDSGQHDISSIEHYFPEIAQLRTYVNEKPPESLLDDFEIYGPDVNEQNGKTLPRESLLDDMETTKTSPNTPDESILDDLDTPRTDPNAPDESLLDDIAISGPDATTKKDFIDILNQVIMLNAISKFELESEKSDFIYLESSIKNYFQIPTGGSIIAEPKTKPDSTTPIIQKELTKPVETKPTQTNTKPTLSLPKQVIQEATGPAGANVSYSTSSQDKEDGVLTPTCDHPSGSTFQIGTTTVSCSAKDSNNNSISGTFTITVRDTTPPDIPAFQPTEGVRDETGVQVFFEVAATDLVDGNVPASCNYPSGYKFPIGTTVLTCTADDSRGNHASRSLQITVTIKETGQ